MRGMLYLASTSPRRRELLARAGIEFELHPPGPEPTGSGTPADRATQRACSKAELAAAPPAPGLVLGVDTIVVVGRSLADPMAIDDGREFGKPTDRQAAAAMLESLAGRDHVVLTAHCVVDTRSRQVATACATARVRCHELAADEIERYLDSGEWTDKAGGYGIQGAAGTFMHVVDGELDTVIGLNLTTVRRLIEAAS
jgi:septum formation protein